MTTPSTLETEHVWRPDFVRLVCTHPPTLKAILHAPFFKLHMAIDSHQQRSLPKLNYSTYTDTLIVTYL